MTAASGRRRWATAVRGVGTRVARTRVGTALRRPTVSVIVPYYNVERYLASCLDSILGQEYPDFEVILVDDGSPDGSRTIAEQYVARDARLTLVTRENGGLGAARNTGVRHARGRYLTFVDSDDLLPPGALRALVSSAQETGSDIVAGSVERFDSFRTWTPSWVPEVHDDRRAAVTIEEFEPLLRNLYTWDKLFRRGFWDVQGLWFREGVAYEDQPIITQLFARAARIDVIPEVVYRYRARDDFSSISQQTASLGDLRARILAWRVSAQVLRTELPPHLYEAWLHTLLDVHFHWYLTSAGTVDDVYWSELVDAIRERTAETPRWVWEATDPARRVLVRLAELDRRGDAQEFVRQGALQPERWPATLRADGVLMQLPYVGDPDLDDSLFLLREDQMVLWHSVENLHWVHHADGVDCCVQGWAHLPKVDLSQHDMQVSVVLRGDATGEEHVFPATEHPESTYPPPAGDRWADQEPGTFGVAFPLAGVVRGAPTGVSWTVLLRVEGAGLSVTRPVRRLLRAGAAGLVPAAVMQDGVRVVVEWSVNRVLRLRMDRTGVPVTAVTVRGRTLSGTLGRSQEGMPVTVVASAAGGEVEGRVDPGPEGGPARFTVDLPESPFAKPEASVSWRLHGLTGRHEPMPLVPLGSLGPDAGAGLLVRSTRTGELESVQWRLGAEADSAEVTSEGVLRVRGRIFGADTGRLALVPRSHRTVIAGPQVTFAGGRFVASVPLQHQVYRFGSVPLPLGDHHLSVDVEVGSDAPSRIPLRVSALMNEHLPIPVHAHWLEGRIVRGPDDQVTVTLLRPVGDTRGPFQQRLLREAHQSARRTLTRGVLMRSYFGELATDNGLSIQRELRRRGSDLPVYWTVQDHSVVVPEGGIPVVVNSREWYRLLGSVTYYIDNMYQPDYHSKPEGQVLVQTFHGYPFKLMGHPHWVNQQFSRAKIETYDARARQWDYLVSPARYATPLLTRDFAYDGEVLEIGYPRNDILNAPEADDLRARVRQVLGIADTQTAVLYAPTFRDYLTVSLNVARMPDFFDFDLAHRQLGDDVVFLVRGHAYNARTLGRRGSGAGCLDVTDYPEVSDLYLAADVAVVDYSSLRFDFGVTRKPMVFHVPDLHRYQETRGWLFDFEPTAPGPLVETTEEVVEALRDLPALREQYAAAYDRFAADYLDLEDGQAGKRFVDRVFVPRGDA